jgi:phospholipase D1/2
VFNCIPTEEITSNQELKEHQKKPMMAQTDPERARKELKKVKGHIVLMPLQFLVRENLAPAVGTKEAFVPTIVWT